MATAVYWSPYSWNALQLENSSVDSKRSDRAECVHAGFAYGIT